MKRNWRQSFSDQNRDKQTFEQKCHFNKDVFNNEKRERNKTRTKFQVESHISNKMKKKKKSTQTLKAIFLATLGKHLKQIDKFKIFFYVF